MRRTTFVLATALLVIGAIGATAQARAGGATKAPAAPAVPRPCGVIITINPGGFVRPGPQHCEQGGDFVLTIINHDTDDWTITIAKTMKQAGQNVPVLQSDVTVPAQAGKTVSQGTTIRPAAFGGYRYTLTFGPMVMDPDIDVAVPSGLQQALPRAKKGHE